MLLEESSIMLRTFKDLVKEEAEEGAGEKSIEGMRGEKEIWSALLNSVSAILVTFATNGISSKLLSLFPLVTLSDIEWLPEDNTVVRKTSVGSRAGKPVRINQEIKTKLLFDVQFFLTILMGKIN